MSRNIHVATAVRRALVIGVIAGASSPAFAQQAPADTEGAVLESIVVTGSRIRQPNLESTSPVTQVTAADITTQGVTRVEDLINQLPQAFAAQNATVANGATGTATVDLRGLGSARTLVLVDGRRMPYGGVTNSAADLNQIPSQLIERVEILTGGASAIYGSDAIAGVVNFITKKNFEGVEIEAGYNFYQHKNSFDGPGATKLRQVIANRSATNPAQFQLPDDSVTDGFGRQASILIGVNTPDGRGNFTAYLTVEDNDEVLQRDRDYSACSLDTIVSPTVSFACGGSSTASPGRFTNFGVGGAPYNFTVGSDGQTWRGFNGSLDQYNFGPTNHYLRPATRYNFGASGHYQLNEKADVYTQLMFTDYRSVAQIAPGGLFIFDTSTINCDNPFIPAANFAAINCTPALRDAGGSTTMYIGRRNTEGGGRQSAFLNNSMRAIVGIRGNFAEGWDYDVSAQRSIVKANEKTLNYFVIDRIKKALDVVTDPETLQPRCRSSYQYLLGNLPSTQSTPGAALNPLFDSGCVPYNPFRTGAVTQESLNYLQAPGVQIGQIDQEIYLASVTGDLGTYGIQLPSANEPVQIALGVEYRRDSLENETDALLASAALSGRGGATIGITGTTTVRDYFMEARVPLVQGKSLAEDLSFDTAFRYSDYGDINTNTYKFGLQWSPIEDIKLRASFQRAVRAANIVELFTARGFNLFDIDGDPCGPSVGTEINGITATPAQCLATGVPAAFIGQDILDSPAGQYQFTQGGNTELEPEESDTKTFGIILQPRFLPGFVASFDYFDIKVDNLISTYGAINTLAACYNNNDATACARIQRNPANGILWGGPGNVLDFNINIGGLKTKGVDTNLSYSGIELGGFGTLSFNLQGTYLQDLITNPGPGIDPYDCTGFFVGQCGVPNPKWRHHFRIGYQTPWNLDLALTWRYFDGVKGFGQAANRIDDEFASQSYVDIAGTYTFTDKIRATVGVNNVLDRDPPLNAGVGTTGNGNTYPQTYDALGRYVFGRVSVGF